MRSAAAMHREGACTERECIRGEVVPGPDAIDEEEEQNAERNHQGEEDIRPAGCVLETLR